MIKHNYDENNTILLKYIPRKVKEFIELNYYQKTNDISRVENLIHDKSFLEKPLSHIALYDDHGVIHVQNVTLTVIYCLDKFNGILFKHRGKERLEWMKHYGALIAYLHDAGMCNCSDFGRNIHAEFIAQELYTKKFSEYIDSIWNDPRAEYVKKIAKLIKGSPLIIDEKTVLREMLAMTCCHSKSCIPADLLNNLNLLRANIQNIIKRPLQEQHVAKLIKKWGVGNTDEFCFNQAKVIRERDKLLSKFYQDYYQESFAWLTSNNQEQEIISDIIDTIRVLRAADALRQRGIMLKTSGAYPILLDPMKAKTIYSIFMESGENILLETDNDINAGEASLKFSGLTNNGDLEFVFFTGKFHSEEISKKIAQKIALMIDDVQLDVIKSFEHEHFKLKEPMKIVLQEPADNFAFADTLREALIERNPELKERIDIKPDLSLATELERERYSNGINIDNLDANSINYVLINMKRCGLKTDALDKKIIFSKVKQVILKKGEYLFRAYDPPEFAYVCFDSGLIGIPAGGYGNFLITPWIIIGHLGIIANTMRNSSIYATKSLDLLMIPKSVYLKYWYKPYSPKEFTDLLLKIRTNNKPEPD